MSNVKKAPRGEKSIVLLVTLWPDKVEPGQAPGTIVPKKVHDHGNVYARANGSHGITTLPDNKSAVFFNSLADLPAAIQELAARHGITLVEGGAQ